MEKRSIKIGSYDTAAHGWTLTAFKLTDPEVKENYVEKTGGDGSWDLTTAMTGGIPRYKIRTLTVNLECSKGNRSEREDLINEMVNELDGLEWPIVLPDRPDHYLQTRVRVAVDYSDLAHAAVTITAKCEPWFYNSRESIVELTATEATQTVYLRNGGRRAVVPVLTVNGQVNLAFELYTTQIETGVYEWSPLLLTTGLHALEYSGNGTLQITYREAVLR